MIQGGRKYNCIICDQVKMWVSLKLHICGGKASELRSDGEPFFRVRTSQGINYSLSFLLLRSPAPDHFHVLRHTFGRDKRLFAALLMNYPIALLTNDIPPIDEVVCSSFAVQVRFSPYVPLAHCGGEVTGLAYKVSWQRRICKNGQ